MQFVSATDHWGLVTVLQEDKNLKKSTHCPLELRGFIGDAEEILPNVSEESPTSFCIPPIAREVLAVNMIRLRSQRQWSQEALAFEAGLHRTFVAHVVRRVPIKTGHTGLRQILANDAFGYLEGSADLVVAHFYMLAQAGAKILVFDECGHES